MGDPGNLRLAQLVLWPSFVVIFKRALSLDVRSAHTDHGLPFDQRLPGYLAVGHASHSASSQLAEAEPYYSALLTLAKNSSG